MNSGNYKYTSIQKIAQSMRELGFMYKINNGYNMYKVSVEELKMLADKKKWLHDLDNDEIAEDDVEEADEDYDNGVDKTDQSVDIKAEYEKQIADLKHQLFVAKRMPEYKQILHMHMLRQQELESRK